MSKLIIEGNALPNMPWQDRPADSNAPMWRYSENPIIPRDLLPTSNSIFNSAVVPFGNRFAARAAGGGSFATTPTAAWCSTWASPTTASIGTSTPTRSASSVRTKR